MDYKLNKKLHQALELVQNADKKISELKNKSSEPIAIVGMSCRFPGSISNPDEYWNLLKNGENSIGDIGNKRFDSSKYYSTDKNSQDKIYTKDAGLLDQVKGFDYELFKISKKEAESMDPQQKLLMELAWEAFENAGYDPLNLPDKKSGVYIGMMNTDYLYLLEELNGYVGSGNAISMASGRLSYFFNLDGPSLTLDTACSSALVSMHMGIQALRNKEINSALVGAANLILSPRSTIVLCKANMLSPTGRCHAFDDRADGYVRAEGGGVMVLKRLSDAVRDKDYIHAVIKGSAVNQDAASQGLTAPNGKAQEDVIRKALENAKVDPSEVGYVEAHGTGTPLGDPIEIESLTNVYCQENRTQKLSVGTSKINVGHTEGSAGIAGLFSAIQSLKNGQIKPHSSLKNINKHISLNPMIEFTESLKNWEKSSNSRLAAVSSFGFSGTNVHVIVEEYNNDTNPMDSTQIKMESNKVFLSGPSVQAVKKHASAIASSDAFEKFKFENIVHSLNQRNTNLKYRATLDVSCKEELKNKLQSDFEIVKKARKEICFLFTGQGSQYANMAKDLFHFSEQFRKTIEKCDEILVSDWNISLLDMLFTDRYDLADTKNTQPALLCLEYALAKTWIDSGVRPKYLLGHSLGEISAACVAGVFSIRDGIKIAINRARLMDEYTEKGAMLAVIAKMEDFSDLLHDFSAEVQIASINGQSNYTLSGQIDAINQLSKRMSEQKIFHKKLDVSHAFHTRMMQPMLEPFRSVLKTVKFSKPNIKIISNLTGDENAEFQKIDYWLAQIGETVQFLKSANYLKDRVDLCLEIGPKPHLSGMLKRSESKTIKTFHCLNENNSDLMLIQEAIQGLRSFGLTFNHKAFLPNIQIKKVPLPNTEFERKDCFVTAPVEYLISERPINSVESAKNERKGFAFEKIESPFTKNVFHFQVQKHWTMVQEHSVNEKIVYPGAGYLTVALSLFKSILSGKKELNIDSIDFIAPMVFEKEEEIKKECCISYETQDEKHLFKIFSKSLSGEWEQNCEGIISQKGDKHKEANFFTDFDTSAELVNADALYKSFKDNGIVYGKNFRGLKNFTTKANGKQLDAQISISDEVIEETALQTITVDCALQSVAPLIADNFRGQYLPFSMENCLIPSSTQGKGWVRAKLLHEESGNLKAELKIYTKNGDIAGHIKNVHFKKSSSSKTNIVETVFVPKWFESRNFDVPLTANLRVSELIDLERAHQNKLKKIPVFSNGDIYDDFQKLCAAYIVEALTDLGIDFKNSQNSFTIQDLFIEFRLDSKHENVLRNFLEVLREEKILEKHGQEFLVTGKAIGSSQEIEEKLKSTSSLAGILAEFELLRSTGNKLSTILKGDIDAIDVLFGNDTQNFEGAVYLESEINQSLNRYIKEIVKNMEDRLSPTKGLTILEVGAGTGGTTSQILPYLDQEKTKYVHSDISPVFGEKLKSTYEKYDNIEFKTLDVIKDFEGQGFREKSYDVIIAANILHAIPDVEAAIKNLRRLIKKDGVLILNELVLPMRWLDLTFGLTPGWWLFNDKIRKNQNSPLLAESEWQKLLKSNGLDSFKSFHANDSQTSCVMLAKNSKSTNEEELVLVGNNGQLDKLISELEQREVPFKCIGYGDDLENIVNPKSKLVILAPNLETSKLPDSGVVIEYSKRFLKLIQTLVSRDASNQVMVTGLKEDFGLGSLRGMMKVVLNEHPEFNPKIVSYSETTTATELVDELLSKNTSFEVDIATGERLSEKIVPMSSDAENSMADVDYGAGTCLVAGGLRGIGFETAKYLVGKGAKSLVLFGRSLPGSKTQAIISKWQEMGIKIAVKQCDITSFDQLSQMISSIPGDFPAIRGIIDSVGVLSDAIIKNQTEETFDFVLKTKIAGAINLLKATKGIALDYFVLYSSVTSVLGTPGQINHAAANSFLDSVAENYKSNIKKLISINWGAWKKVGAASEKGIDSRLENLDTGLGAYEPNEGLEVLDYILNRNKSQVVALPITDKHKVYDSANRYLQDLFSEVLNTAKVIKNSSINNSEDSSGLKEEIASQSNDLDKRLTLSNFLRQEIANLAQLSPDEIEFNQRLFDLPFDSLMVLELKNKLTAALDYAFRSTFIFDHPTIDELTDFIMINVLGIVEEQEQQDENQNDSEDVEIEFIENLAPDEAISLLEKELESLQQA